MVFPSLGAEMDPTGPSFDGGWFGIILDTDMHIYIL